MVYLHEMYSISTDASTYPYLLWMRRYPTHGPLPLWVIWHNGLQFVDSLIVLGIAHISARTQTLFLLPTEHLRTHRLLILNLLGSPSLPVLPCAVFKLHTDLEGTLAKVGADVQSFFLGNALTDLGEVTVLVEFAACLVVGGGFGEGGVLHEPHLALNDTTCVSITGTGVVEAVGRTFRRLTASLAEQSCSSRSSWSRSRCFR